METKMLYTLTDVATALSVGRSVPAGPLAGAR